MQKLTPQEVEQALQKLIQDNELSFASLGKVCEICRERGNGTIFCK